MLRESSYTHQGRQFPRATLDGENWILFCRTIQPEIVESETGIAEALSHISASAAAEIGLEEEGCAVLCGDDPSCQILSCCPPTAVGVATGTNTPTHERAREP